MSSLKKSPVYVAYLLRCWLEGSVWRYSLEEIGASNRHAFATLDELFSFMLARSILPDDIESQPSADVDQTETKRNAGVKSEDSSSAG